jgi:hypothetical protein
MTVAWKGGRRDPSALGDKAGPIVTATGSIPHGQLLER